MRLLNQSSQFIADEKKKIIHLKNCMFYRWELLIKQLNGFERTKIATRLLPRLVFQSILAKVTKNAILKPYKNFPNLETVKEEMKKEKNRILESKRPLMEIN